MAAIHIPEAEAARDLSSVLQQVRDGSEVFIDTADSSFAILDTRKLNGTVTPKPMLLSEVIAALESRGCTATPEAGFGEAVMDGVRSHEHETLTNPWE